MDLFIQVSAPFSAYRYFQTGGYRATAPVIPPSAALGLILNLACIEMRGSTIGTTITPIGENIPHLQLAVGAITHGEISTLYQQLHVYPVGKGDPPVKEAEARTKGQKALAKMARREILVGLNCAIALRNPDDWLVDRIHRGLAGDFNSDRYGLPFAGDNNFLFDCINLMNEPPDTYWYVQMQPHDPPQEGSCRLTVGIDRADNSKTTSLLYAPVTNPIAYPPDDAWTWTPKNPDTAKV